MHTPKWIVATLAVIAATNALPQNDPDISMHKRLHLEKKLSRSIESNYLLFLPEGYEAKGKAWPLMIFLHGAGERGTNLSRVAQHGPPKIVKDKKDFPFVLVSPQCPSGARWNDETILALIDETIAKYNVDTNRVYLTGLSMGGYGSWSLATKYPERFAAVVPICGGGEIIDILLKSGPKGNALKTLGVWAFHGGKDPVVPLSESERMVDTLKKAGCTDVKLTVFPEAGHDSWTEAYNTPGLWDWFLQHSRASK